MKMPINIPKGRVYVVRTVPRGQDQPGHPPDWRVPVGRQDPDVQVRLGYRVCHRALPAVVGGGVPLRGLRVLGHG